MTIGRRGVLAAGLGCLAAPMIPMVAGATDVPLLVYDVRSANAPKAPLLQIDSDGTAWVREAPGHAPAVRAQLPDARIQRIVDFLVGDIGFLTIDDAQILAEMERLKAANSLGVQIADGGVTRIDLSVPQGRNSVELYATAMAATVFPEIEALQRVRRAEVFLLDLVAALRQG